MTDQCHRCHYVFPSKVEKVSKCPRCNFLLASSPIAENPSFDSQAGAWLEMRRKAGVKKRVTPPTTQGASP